MSTFKRERKNRDLVAQAWAKYRANPKGTKKHDVKPTNPKDVAASARIDLSLFPASARAYGALAMVEGDLKYGGFNYREMGVLASVYYSAVGRHLDKWFNGEDADQKTGVPHLASALACVAILIDSVEQGNMNDDRPPRQETGIYDCLEEKVRHLHVVFPRRTPRYRAAMGIGTPRIRSLASYAGSSTYSSAMEMTLLRRAFGKPKSSWKKTGRGRSGGAPS